MHIHKNAFINQKLHGPLTRKYKRKLLMEEIFQHTLLARKAG